MQLEALKTCIETIRKNPKAYLNERLPMLDTLLSEGTQHELLCLLFAATALDTSAIFEKLDEAVCRRDNFPSSIYAALFYEMAKGIHARSIFAYTTGLSHFVKAYDLAIQIDDAELVARILLYLSTSFDGLGNREQAMRYARNAVQMVPQIEQNTLIGDIYLQYGLMHERQGDLFECLNAYRYAEAYYDRNPERESYLNYCILLMNAGRNHLKLGHEQMAESYIGRALAIAEAGDFMVYLHNTIKLISDFYMNKGDFKRANEVLNHFLQSHIHASLSKARVSTSQMDMSFIDKLDSLHQLYRRNHKLTEELKVLHGSEQLPVAVDQTSEITLKHLAEAIRRDEFIPFLQAKWDVKTGKITGAEMLARWYQSDGTVVMPNDFINLLENSDLILLFTENMVHKTLKQVASIVHQGNPHFLVSFNISTYQLIHQDLVKLFEACCVEYHLSAKNIEVEIVERTFIESHPKAIEQLFRLKEKGFGISLDDFGSGYSSLGCIVELPVDTVKIDRSLVKAIDQNLKAQQLFTSIVGMLKGLGMNIVAEGVETEAQLAILKACECDEGQGFLVHRPCEAQTFPPA